MINDRKQVITIHLNKMNIGKNNQSLVLRAMNASEPSKASEKVLNKAYKFALLIDSNALNKERETNMCRILSKACDEYYREMEKLIDLERY